MYLMYYFNVILNAPIEKMSSWVNTVSQVMLVSVLLPACFYYTEKS